MKKVLNVGGNSKAIRIPGCYASWTHHLLDIDPTGNPDIVCDARDLQQIAAKDYDSVYCSHNLEHYFSHDVPRVLRGFHHVLKDEGFVFIKVPDVLAVMQRVVRENLDIEDVLYESPIGSIKVKDVIYGLGSQIEKSGCDFFAHKTGFSLRSLLDVLESCGFAHAYHVCGELEICVIAFKQAPSQEAHSLLGLDAFNRGKPAPAAPVAAVVTQTFWGGKAGFGFTGGLG